MAFCTQCGSPSDGGRFCARCGAPVGAAAASAQSPYAPGPAAAPSLAGYAPPPPAAFGGPSTSFGDPSSTSGFPSAAGDRAPAAPAAPAPPAAGRRKHLTPIVVVVAVVALLLAGGGVWWLARSSAVADSGATDPQSAVQALVDAVQAGDLIGAMNTLPPAEAALFVDTAQAAVAQAQRMDILASADLHHVTAGSISFSNLNWGTPKELSDTVTLVPLRGGTVTVKGSVPDIPFTQRMFDLLDNDGFAKGQATVAIAGAVDGLRNAGINAIPIVTVKTAGGWHVSLLYTCAELFRQGLGASGKLDTAISPAGASSPEDAVTQFLQRLAKLDFRGAIALTDPGEDAVLYDYGTALLRRFSPGDVRATIKLSDLDLKVQQPVNGRTPVAVQYATVTWDDGYRTQGFRWDGSCWSEVRDGQGRGDSVCAGDPPRNAALRRWAKNPLSALSPVISTVSVGGSWYVAIGRTALASVLPQLDQWTIDDFAGGR